MPNPPEPAQAIHARVLAHLLTRVRAAAAWDEPFAHAYFEDVFPADVYAALLAHLPPNAGYRVGPSSPNARYHNRAFYNLTLDGVRRFPPDCRELWRGVAAALTDPELKRGLYAKLAPDLVYRFGVAEAGVPDLPGHPRPTLYRDTDGFEIPPHPDTLAKVVTMHLYLPADASRAHLGTALYRPRSDTLGRVPRRECFTVAKQFEFRPNSGYAFVVNDSPGRRSWHGRERLPAGSGARNSLLNTFYTEPRREYAGYLGEDGSR